MSTKKLTVLSISTALQVCILLISMAVPTIKLSMLFLASILNGIMCMAGHQKRYVLLSYIATGALSILLIPNYIIPAAYILLFGGYGIVHFMCIDKKVYIQQIVRYSYLALSISLFYILFRGMLATSALLSPPIIYFVLLGIAILYPIFQMIYNMVLNRLFAIKGFIGFLA